MLSEEIKVLLVDDDQGDFEMIRVMLAQTKELNFQVDWVSTFEEAVDAFQEDKHDIYFLDYFLEDRSGLDLLTEAKIRGLSAPVLMLTGRGSGAVEAEAMAAGAAGYLVKGLFDPEALEERVREVLELPSGVSSPGAQGTPEAGTPPGAEEGSEVGEARFQALFQSTRSGVALVGLDGVLRGVNPAFAQALSTSPRWTEGMSFVELLDEPHRASFLRELDSLSAGNQSRLEAERTFMGKEGDLFFARTTALLIRSSEGVPDHILVVLEFEN